MAGKLAERLKELAAFLAHQNAVDSVEELVGHMQTEIADAMARSRSKAQQCTILLFQSTDPPCLLDFLTMSVDYTTDSRKREIAHARASVLGLIASFLKAYSGNKALSKKHLVAIFKTCQLTARADPFSRVKAQALLVVINVLKFGGSLVSNEDIEPRAYLDKLFNDIKFSKATQTAKGQMLEVIGYLVTKFPGDVENSLPSLLSWIEDALEKQFSSNSPEMLLVNGLLFSLARLLVCDRGRYEKDEATRKKIYSYLLTVFTTTADGNLSRYQVTKSSLIFLAEHASTFQQEIGPSGHTWFSYMQFCCTSDNKTIKEHAFNCSNAIFETLSAYMLVEKDDVRKKCLSRILKEVLPVINDPGADTAAVGFAIQCLGWLARPISVFLGAKGYNKIEERLKKFGENLLALDAKATASRWSLFSQFVRCIGQFVREQGQDVPLDDGYVNFLGDMLCHLMTAYPRCLWKSKVMVHKSIIAVFDAVSKRTVVEPLVDRFVFHTLLLSISNITSSEDMIALYHPDTGEMETKLVYEYEGFWLALLRCGENKSGRVVTVAKEGSGGEDVEMEDVEANRRTLQAVIFDSVVKKVLDIIEQLDLSYKYDLQTTNNGKNAGGYLPAVPRDHSIMLNLTEYVERVIAKLPRPLLLPWIPQLLHLVFVSATKMPLVSSFYRFGTVLAMTTDELQYFDTSVDLEGVCHSDARACLRDEFAYFVTKVSAQIRFYQDELLVACAAFVLATPVGLFPASSGVLKPALELGRSFLPAASIAITALERWQRQCPEELGLIIGDIVPLLAPYLDQSDASDAGGSSVNTEAVNSSDFSRLQHRVMVFLGNSGGKGSLLMSEPPAIVNPDGVIGDTSMQYFQLSLDLNGVAVPLALHKIFAYLGELAIQSTDRRVKTSASEGYHALVCYLCGKTATHPHAGGNKSVFYELWRKAFSNIVLLATDPEKICRALFEPLLFQLLRWFASNNDGFPFEYANLLDQLVRGLSDPENSAVRALSGRGIATLLTLSLEGQASGSGARTKADDIFRRLFSLCRHPGAAQRSGAATAMSCFLRSLNEEDGPSLTTFALDCVKNLLYALRLCDRDVRNGIGGADVSQDLISRAVLKIERGISRFSQLFLKAAPSGEDSVLQQMTMWLFQQTAKRECLFRRLCRRVFASFSALVTGSSCKQWLIDYATQYGGSSIGAILVPMSALARELPSSSENGDMIDWMEQLSASIESCTWCVGILGDKTEELLGFDAPDGQRGDLKRKHSELPTEPTSEVVQSYQRAVSWAINNFLKSEAPWKDPNPALMASSTRTQLNGAYLSVLVSLCNCITASMDTENTLLVQIADFRNPSFQAAVAKKLLQSFVYQPHAWADDEHAFDEIRAFCAGQVIHNKDWAREMQRCAEALLLPLSTCLAEVSSEDDYNKRAREIRALCVFGNEVLSIGILQQSAASRHDTVFALAANISIKFGRSLPDHRRIAVLALKAATACGWDITTIFVSDAGRRAYGAVHNDVVHFIPTLVAWRQCAKSLVALALTNSQVLNVLVDALDQVASFKLYKAGSAELDSFVETLLPSIKNFVQNLGVHTSDTQQTLLLLEALRLILQLCQYCSKRLVEPLSMGPLPDIRDAVLELLKQRECSYLVKADILRILALLGPSSSLVAEEDEGSMKTVEALVSFVVDEFPIVSTDVTRGSKDFDIFRVLFVGLLAVIEQSKSVAYLRIIFPSLKERQSHLFFEEIKLSLGRFSNGLAVAKSGGANKNDTVLLGLVKLTDILLDSSQDTAIRKTLLEAVFTPLIELQPVDTLQRFYLMESVAAKAVLVGMLATKISTSADVTSAASRFGVSVAFALVEILYRLADPEFIRNDINAAFLGHKKGKGREFTMLVCKCASKVATTYGGGNEVTRLACCHAYSCLLTAVSRTQKQEKFFDQILFQDSVWNNIVDNSREYELHAETKEFDKVPLSSFSTASLQSQRETNARRGASSALNFFTASSLSLDPDTLSVSMTAPVDMDQGGATYHNLEIELDALNEHPCMVPLLRVLMQMKTDFGSNWDERAMPGWMKKLFGVMENTSTELNVRLFLAKVILNVPDVFTPYASSWLEKVMDALLEATVSTSAGSGCEFHYLLRDCCNLVLDAWKEVSVASIRGTASRFLNTLVELCPHRINFIRDDNVLLASQLILLWKDSVSIDVLLLASQLFSDDDDARMQAAKQYTSLQLISAMVTAGQASDLHSELGFVEGQTIEEGILLAMKNKKASLFVVAAEVGGLYSTKAKQVGTFKHELVALITSAYNEEDFGRFLALLRNASLHQPDIIDAMMLHRLSFVLPKVIAVDAWSLLAMETLGNATANEKVTAEIFTHVQSVLDRFIAHRHAGVQYSTLQAVARIVDHLTEADLERLIKNVSQGGLGLLENYEVHEDTACRHLLFGIARQLQKRDIALSIKERVKCALLQGLCDPDANLRREQSEYWNASDLVPGTCSSRLVAVLGALHFPELADKWVLYATNLLVGMSKESDQFELALFPTALGNGDFTEAHIDATWEAKNPTMTPMFSIEADQFGSLLGAPQSDIYAPATLSVATVSSQYNRPPSTLLQSQLLSSGPASQTQVAPGSTAVQYAGTSGAPQAHARGNRGRRFVKQATTAESIKSQHVSSQYGGKATKKFFQDQYAMEKKRQEARSNRERNEQHGRVDMRRKYRVGEFPDIQITQRDLVEPIMALCETHPQTSSIVFAALFSSIMASKAFEQPSDNSALAKNIERSLLLSKTSSVYVGCVELAYLASLVNNEKLFEKLVVSPNVIGVAGLASSNDHASQLLLEEFLICNAQRDSGQSNLTSRDWTATCWDQLHKILGAINKSNFLIALSSTCSTTDESKLALQAQLSGDLPAAVASYKRADDVLASQIEGVYSVAAQSDASRCYWQRMDCLETLNNWDTLMHEINDATTQDNDFLWSQESPYLEQGVGHYLRSCLGLVATSRDGEPSALGRLQHFVNSVAADSAKQELVNSRFPVEKCLAYLAMGDSNQARLCVENFYRDFLSKWQHVSAIATSLRSELMQSLSSMVEIDEMLGLVRDGEHRVVNVSGQREIGHLAFVHKWVEAAPFTGEGGLAAWSQFAMVQNYVGGFLLVHGLDQGILSDDARSSLLREKGSVMLKYATAALSGDILALASKNLKDYRELCNAHKLPKVSVEMVDVFVSHVLKLADRQLTQKRSDLNSGSIKLITRYYETATKMFDNVEMMEMMEAVDTDDRVAMGYLEAKTFARAAEFYAVSNVGDGLKEEYFSRALDVFQQSCKLIGATSGVADNELGGGERKAFSRCRLTFVEFLADLLFKDGREKWDQLVNRKLATQLLVDNVLGGMASGDRECSNYFPQLCEVIAPYPDLVASFKRQVLDDVPLWTCLQWSAQLMALLNGPIGETIVAILEKMATQYPVALFYDFKVTCGSSLSSYKGELHRLEALLANPVMEKFVEALRLIHHPELRLKEGLREIARFLADNRTDDAHQKIELLWKDCFSPDRPRLGGQIGRYNRDWSRKAKRDVEKLLGKNGSNMTAKTVTAAREWIMNHFSVTPGRYGITKDMKAQLGDFAEWLEEFDHSSCSLELPGQYTAYWGKPDPTTHIRILSFDSMLGVLASKQLPKRLTLHCSDEKDYTFLVKGGEDLRLDQRIEQLFDVMNQILAVDSRCRDRSLSTRTYKVIPMTQEIGIIEWLHCTSTLKGVIETQLQKDDRCANLQSNKRQKLELFNTSAAKAYESFLLKQRGASFSAKVIAPPSSEVIDQFSKVQVLIPGDLLRRQLLGLGSDFQAFLLVRDHFLKSLAVFSACSYVLGIGDRHLDNFLLDHTNGRVIGIDFGVSFGAGASMLPVPELVPFRYTRQMHFVFQPYDGANLLAQDMQAVFEALRAKKQVIESVMDVFLHEPLMEWQQSTTIHQKGLIQESEGTETPTLHDSDVEMKEEEEPCRTRVSRDEKASASVPNEAGATAWLPDVKIAIARRKLEGVSPKLLLKEELAQNLHLSRQLDKFHSLIDSACGSDSVATGTQEMAAMSSLAQAQELLALATSPDLLGRTYHGWMPWL